eukprot:1142672-Pelagomonas_calceolata.AAC.14
MQRKNREEWRWASLAECEATASEAGCMYIWSNASRNGKEENRQSGRTLLILKAFSKGNNTTAWHVAGAEGGRNMLSKKHGLRVLAHATPGRKAENLTTGHTGEKLHPGAQRV